MTDPDVASVFDELRRLAQTMMAAERSNHTLQATAVVNEAFLRVAGGDVVLDGSPSCMRVMAKVMRQVLIDHARTRGRLKRGGQWTRRDLDAIDAADPLSLAPDQLMDLDEAVDALLEHDAELAEIVILRFFAGYGVDAMAPMLGLPVSTVRSRWRLARRWLVVQLADYAPDAGDGD